MWFIVTVNYTNRQNCPFLIHHYNGAIMYFEWDICNVHMQASVYAHTSAFWKCFEAGSREKRGQVPAPWDLLSFLSFIKGSTVIDF